MRVGDGTWTESYGLRIVRKVKPDRDHSRLRGDGGNTRFLTATEARPDTTPPPSPSDHR